MLSLKYIPKQKSEVKKEKNQRHILRNELQLFSVHIYIPTAVR